MTISKFPSPTRVLVTGANGLLGQKLVARLAADGEVEVLAISRGDVRFKLPEGVSYTNLDLTDRKAVLSYLEATRPGVIINTAAMTNVDACEADKEGCWAANVEAVDHLLEGATAHPDPYFLQVSTDFIFDGEAGPYAETDTEGIKPLSYYGESKWEAEKRVAASGLRHGIARTVLVYGVTPGMSRSNIVLWVKESLEAKKNIKVIDDQWRTPTLAEDLSDGCFRLACQQVEGVFHISGEELMTPYELAVRVANHFELDPKLIEKVDGSIFTQPAARPPKTGFIIDKAKRELGYAPHTFERGLDVVGKQLTVLHMHS